MSSMQASLFISFPREMKLELSTVVEYETGILSLLYFYQKLILRE